MHTLKVSASAAFVLPGDCHPRRNRGGTLLSRGIGHVFIYIISMTSIDFAAAQQRVAERRQRQEAASRARLEARQNSRASNALQRLPSPLQSIGQRGLATWDVIKGREGTRPAFRVGQVDAELLDEELLELLRGQVGEGLKYLGV